MTLSFNRLRTPLRGLFMLALVASFIVALLPSPEGLDLSGGRDKIGHFLAFAGLALLGYAAWPQQLLSVTLGLLSYGVAMELAQSLTSWRQGDIQDWIADAAGVLAALGLHLVWRHMRR